MKTGCDKRPNGFLGQPRKPMRKLVRCLPLACLALVMALLTCVPAWADAPERNVLDLTGLPASESSFPTVEAEVAEITSYGDLVLDITPEDLFAESYLITDVVALEVDGARFVMPLVTAQIEGMPGYPALIASQAGVVKACIPYGRLVEAGGLAGVVAPGDAVAISMVRRGGFAETYPSNQLVRTYERGDYDSDEAYANFRVVEATGLGKGALVRSSTPIDNTVARAWYAATLDTEAGVRCVLNMSNDEDDVPGLVRSTRPASADYGQLFNEGLVCAIAMDIHLGSETFCEGLIEELRFMAEHEGPYLLHCIEGKDRTGFSCMLLEALMGASYEEIAADYLQTFVNFYHVEPGSRQYDVLQGEYVDRFLLKMMTGVGSRERLRTIDLQAKATSYLLGLGLTNGEVEAIRANLSKDYV